MFVNKCTYIIQLSTGDYDIFHPTYYDPYFIKANKGKLVITVYDMIHEIYPDLMKDEKLIKNKRALICAADRIIAISESTKRDILKFYPDIPENRIKVVYIGSSFTKSESYGDNTLPREFVLFVGNRNMYKNYKSFFKSMKPILDENKGISVVCLGGGPFTADEMQFQQGYEGRIIQINASDASLSYAYSHAKCFVFPSLYEGFGIPTLEAFACDCPVVLSNTSSMPEVGGDAAVYFDPNDTAEMTRKIEMVLNNEPLREEMIIKGRQQLKKFEWSKIARETVECYRETLEKDKDKDI